MSGIAADAIKQNERDFATMLKHFDAVRFGINTGSIAGCQAAARLVFEKIQELLDNVGTGRVYERQGYRHVASSPGAPPAMDTGNLRMRFFISEPIQEGDRWVVFLWTDVPYAPMLEFGTRYMFPRVFWRKAVEFVLFRAQKLIAAEIERAERKALRAAA